MIDRIRRAELPNLRGAGMWEIRQVESALVLPDRYLLIAIIVTVPSTVRSAANTATLSVLVPVAATRAAPWVDLLPS